MYLFPVLFFMKKRWSALMTFDSYLRWEVVNTQINIDNE